MILGAVLALDFFQITILAFIQGLTEFLPISSSAHLILPSALFGWPDQGLTFDVAVHFGTLIAVMSYFWIDIKGLSLAWLQNISGKPGNKDSHLAWLLILSSVPAGIAGFILNDFIETSARSILVIASTSVVFAILLYWSDYRSLKNKELAELSWQHALVIGFAQILAIIPGTSRSGITITAALLCQFNRKAAARFSFLMAVPIIFVGGLMRSLELLGGEDLTQQLPLLMYATVLSMLVAFACIHYFLKLIEKIGFTLFVIYRIVLGMLLFMLYLFS